MNEDKICRYLGLARRAGKLVWGFEAVLRQSQMQTKMVIVIATDIAERSRKELLLAIRDKQHISVINHATKETIGYAIGRKETGIVGCIDEGIAKQLIALSESDSGGGKGPIW